VTATEWCHICGKWVGHTFPHHTQAAASSFEVFEASDGDMSIRRAAASSDAAVPVPGWTPEPPCAYPGCHLTRYAHSDPTNAPEPFHPYQPAAPSDAELREDDRAFLAWCHERFAVVFHESPNLDWMQRLAALARQGTES